MKKKPKSLGSGWDINYESILGDISNVIDAARKSAARSVNYIMTAAYWLTGRRIVEFEQGGKERADYGEDLVRRLSTDLTAKFGRGFAKSNLYQMRSFYLSHMGILQTASGIYATALPISGDVRPLEKFQTVFGISSNSKKNRTLSSEIALRELANCFPLSWSSYVMASEYRTALPDEKELAAEIERTQALLQDRKRIAMTLRPAIRTKKGKNTTRSSAGKKGATKRPKGS